MKTLPLTSTKTPLSLLILGAHSDDIEIGVGGTVLSLLASDAKIDVTWCVFSAGVAREGEARASAAAFLAGSVSSEVDILGFRDGFFPQQGEKIKEWFESIKPRKDPDVIFTHYRDDAHQDHREICQLTWNTFRNHLILEYEIPKWDGDLSQPNAYFPLSDGIMERKIDLLQTHFKTQRGKHWFDMETFRGLARLRGNECRAPERYAEAFYARKLALS
jgi:LmbE family N-acetylglucosaminyl deacetylase